jgi:hypothetical protein
MLGGIVRSLVFAVNCSKNCNLIFADRETSGLGEHFRGARGLAHAPKLTKHKHGHKSHKSGLKASFFSSGYTEDEFHEIFEVIYNQDRGLGRDSSLRGLLSNHEGKRMKNTVAKAEFLGKGGPEVYAWLSIGFAFESVVIAICATTWSVAFVIWPHHRNLAPRFLMQRSVVLFGLFVLGWKFLLCAVNLCNVATRFFSKLELATSIEDHLKGKNYFANIKEMGRANRSKLQMFGLLSFENMLYFNMAQLVFQYVQRYSTFLSVFVALRPDNATTVPYYNVTGGVISANATDTGEGAAVEDAAITMIFQTLVNMGVVPDEMQLAKFYVAVYVVIAQAVLAVLIGWIGIVIGERTCIHWVRTWGIGMWYQWLVMCRQSEGNTLYSKVMGAITTPARKILYKGYELCRAQVMWFGPHEFNNHLGIEYKEPDWVLKPLTSCCTFRGTVYANFGDARKKLRDVLGIWVSVSELLLMPVLAILISPFHCEEWYKGDKHSVAQQCSTYAHLQLLVTSTAMVVIVYFVFGYVKCVNTLFTTVSKEYNHNASKLRYDKTHAQIFTTMMTLRVYTKRWVRRFRAKKARQMLEQGQRLEQADDALAEPQTREGQLRQEKEELQSQHHAQLAAELSTADPAALSAGLHQLVSEHIGVAEEKDTSCGYIEDPFWAMSDFCCKFALCVVSAFVPHESRLTATWLCFAIQLSSLWGTSPKRPDEADPHPSPSNCLLFNHVHMVLAALGMLLSLTTAVVFTAFVYRTEDDKKVMGFGTASFTFSPGDVLWPCFFLEFTCMAVGGLVLWKARRRLPILGHSSREDESSVRAIMSAETGIPASGADGAKKTTNAFGIDGAFGAGVSNPMVSTRSQGGANEADADARIRAILQSETGIGAGSCPPRDLVRTETAESEYFDAEDADGDQDEVDDRRSVNFNPDVNGSRSGPPRQLMRSGTGSSVYEDADEGCGQEAEGADEEGADQEGADHLPPRKLVKGTTFNEKFDDL